MKTLVVEINDKSKNDFVLELLSSFPFLTVKDKKDFKNSDKKLVKKYRKSFNEKKSDVKDVKGINVLHDATPEITE